MATENNTAERMTDARDPSESTDLAVTEALKKAAEKRKAAMDQAPVGRGNSVVERTARCSNDCWRPNRTCLVLSDRPVVKLADRGLTATACCSSGTPCR